MFRSKRLRGSLEALICLAFVVAGSGDPHLHLCFDGSEPPETLHVGDAGVHHAGDGGIGHHHDRDVSVTGQALVKKHDAALGLSPFASVVAFVLLSAPPTEGPVPALAPSFALVTAPPGLRPPLRGPPR